MKWIHNLPRAAAATEQGSAVLMAAAAHPLSPVQIILCKQIGSPSFHVVSHFPSWDLVYSGEISYFLLAEGTICSTVRYCNSFQVVGGFYLVEECTVPSRKHVH